MGPVSYVIAILGCADGSAACQQVAVVPARYETQAACQAATADALATSSEFDFPTIVAQCRAAKPQPAAIKREPRRATAVAQRQG
ncbi:hypothetical protein [Sphingomonas arenae]|uniref:hypothetical protein n=1 Tax=Sphingomonas arenae TaxID=2812555 RepID=UPI001967BEB6|nr:hypothetical protein [Sphingomonas arenae]